MRKYSLHVLSLGPCSAFLYQGAARLAALWGWGARVLGPPGTPGSQDLSQPNPEPGSQGHKDNPGPGNRDRPGWTMAGQ